MDLNGYSIRWIGIEDPGIINEGNLTIVNSAENNQGVVSTIENLGGTGIDNDGILTIGNSQNEVNATIPVIKGKTYGIDNTNASATLNFYDGIIKGIDGAINGILANIIKPNGYSINTESEMIGDGENQVTYITNYLSSD